jgi:hypothetical protein
MKISFIFSILVLFVLTSCQKVIEVKLNSAAPQYVIQGEITDSPGPYFVTISRTKDFSADNNFDEVSGALVIITDSTANISDTLKEVITGTYQTSHIQGAYGHTYKLNVTINGQSFYAVSVMPAQAVNIDVLYAGPSLRGQNEIFMTVVFQDPPGKGNYYLLKQWINGAEVKSANVRSDDATDGQNFSVQLRYDTNKDAGNPVIHKGDQIKAELNCINKEVYDYYRTLQSVSGTSNTATPTNPLTNIIGGALGVFNCCTSRTKTTIANF